ncbi:hypothetical protein TrCOL_g4319 [Triparma columacea]|uniref:Uncharacterized protein n=1 Tax=Triparma columacea TaxID=722753 RepID=A0A9W7LF56_9STRA|nr:hypothetical protein TrCOL_g4319 [Triparma columacea]
MRLDRPKGRRFELYYSSGGMKVDGDEKSRDNIDDKLEFMPDVVVVACQIKVGSYEGEEGRVIEYLEGISPDLGLIISRNDVKGVVVEGELGGELLGQVEGVVGGYAKVVEGCDAKVEVVGEGQLWGWLEKGGYTCGEGGVKIERREDGGDETDEGEDDKKMPTTPPPSEQPSSPPLASASEPASPVVPPSEVYRCKKCRTPLFTSSHVTPCTNPNCGQYLLNHPSPVTSHLDYSCNEGKIYCIKQKCKTKIGGYKWSGIMCGCKNFWEGGVVVNMSAVDEVRNVPVMKSVQGAAEGIENVRIVSREVGELAKEGRGSGGQESDGGFRSMRGKSKPKHSTNQ